MDHEKLEKFASKNSNKIFLFWVICLSLKLYIHLSSDTWQKVVVENSYLIENKTFLTRIPMIHYVIDPFSTL